MKKPHLEIMGGNGNVPIWGYCSACRDVNFWPKEDQKNRIEQEAYMHKLFDQHFVKVHLREDVSQAAARIVREATENH